MALINCPECNREISNKAVSCPHCGFPISEMLKVKVHFFREKRYVRSGITGTILIDGKVVGSAENGTSFDVMLDKGTHNVVIRSYGEDEPGSQNENTATLEIPEDAKSVEVKLETKYANIFGRGGGVFVDSIEIKK